MSKSSSKNQHVLPSGARWAVRPEGAKKNSSVHKTQKEAIEAARAAAIQDGVVVVHGADGRVRARYHNGKRSALVRRVRRVLFPEQGSVSDPEAIRRVVRDLMKKSKPAG